MWRGRTKHLVYKYLEHSRTRQGPWIRQGPISIRELCTVLRFTTGTGYGVLPGRTRLLPSQDRFGIYLIPMVWQCYVLIKSIIPASSLCLGLRCSTPQKSYSVGRTCLGCTVSAFNSPRNYLIPASWQIIIYSREVEMVDITLGKELE